MSQQVMTAYELYQNIRDKLDTSIPYAKERVKQLEPYVDSEAYINAVSDKGFISQQVKTKNDFLSEGSTGLANHLEKLADYILYCKYDDEHNEQEIMSLNEAIKVADRVNHTKRDKLRLIKGRIKPHRRIETSRRGNYREVHASTPSELDNQYGRMAEREGRVVYSFQDKELNQKGRFKNSRKYWEHYCQTGQNVKSNFLKGDLLPYGEFAYECLKALEVEIRRLEETLDTLDKDSRKYKTIKNRDLKTLKSNYNASAEVLRKPTVLNMTMVLNVSALDVLDEAIDYQNFEVMKTLLLNSFEIRREGKKRVDSMMWVLSQDIDDKIRRVRTRLTPIQNMILTHLVNDKNVSGTEIISSILKEYNIEISKMSLSRHINKIVERIIELDDKNYVLTSKKDEK